MNWTKACQTYRVEAAVCTQRNPVFFSTWRDPATQFCHSFNAEALYTVVILYNPVANITTHNPQKCGILITLQKALFCSKVHQVLLNDCKHTVKSHPSRFSVAAGIQQAASWLMIYRGLDCRWKNWSSKCKQKLYTKMLMTCGFGCAPT